MMRLPGWCLVGSELLDCSAIRTRLRSAFSRGRKLFFLCKKRDESVRIQKSGRSRLERRFLLMSPPRRLFGRKQVHPKVRCCGAKENRGVR